MAHQSFEPVRIGCIKIADHLAVGGVDQGLTDSEGIRFETIFLRSFQRIKQALADREIQGALLPLPTAFDLYGKGMDIRLLLLVNREGGMLLYNRKAGFGDLKKFSGKSVLVPSLLSVESMLLHRFLTKAGFKVGKGTGDGGEVRMAEISPHLMMEVAEQDMDGEIAGFLMPEPFAGRALERGVGGFVLNTRSLWSCHPSSVLVFDQTFLQEYPGAVRSFVALLEEGGRRITRSSQTEFSDFTEAFFGERLGPDSPVTQRREEIFSPRLFPPDFDTIRLIMSYMASRMGMADCSGKTDDFIQTGWCSEQENQDLK